MEKSCPAVLDNGWDGPPGKIFNIRISLIAVLILVSVTIPLFSGMFNHSFVNYDDYRIIVNRIDTFDGFTLKNLKRIILEDYPREEPLILRDISYLVNASLFGPLNPKGYLLGNLLLHILVCYLVYLLSLYIFPHQYLLALLAAVFFSIHPMHVESIAWISSRKDPLYVSFLLAALLAYMRFLNKCSVINLLYSMLLFCCALFSKSAAISFFPLLISYRITLKRAEALTRKEILFFAGVMTITILFIVWYTGILVEFGVMKKSLTAHRDWGLWLLSSFAYITFYIEKLLVPVNLSIMYDYPAPYILFSNRNFVFLSIGIATIGLTTLAIFWRRRINQLVFLGLFFISASLPYLDLAQVNIYVANRYTYLASSAFCIFLAYGFLIIDECCLKIRRLCRPLLIVICIGYCAFLGFQTIQAIRPWENTLKLWQNASKVANNRLEIYNHIMKEYMLYYLENIKDKEAKTALQVSMELGESALERFCNNSLNKCPKQLYELEFNLAQIYWLQGKTKKTEEYLKASLRLNPLYYKAHYLFARFLIDQKRTDEAMVHINFINNNADPQREKDLFSDIKNKIIPEIEKGKVHEYGN